MNDDLPLARPHFSEAAIAAAAAALRSGWPGPGPEVEAFEAELAEWVGAEHAVAVASATAGLQIAVAMADLPEGSEVITTPNTFVSTNHVLLHAGLTPVFADIERHTGNIDAGAVAAAITDATSAVMVVHYAGYPCDLDAITAIADDHGLVVIEDAAHALGACYRGQPIGLSADRTCVFSFQATKNLSAVDGGALMVASADRAERARKLRWMGIDASTYKRQTDDGYHWNYDVIEAGFRSTMSDLNAALARVGLRELAEMNARRAAIADRYRSHLADLPGVDTMHHEPDRTSANCLFPITVEEGRDRVIGHLRTNGIGAGVHYQANDRHPVYKPAYLPEAHWFSDHALSLPMHLGLGDADVDRVCETVAAALD